MIVLHSKLQAPKRYNILHRKRLVGFFHYINPKKLITVIAGAGYGKTTLVMDALSTLNCVSIWYRLDEQDTDFQVFISYLYSAIQQKFFNSGEHCGINLINPKSGLKKQTDILLEWLSILEQKALEETFIVLDDYHLVQESMQINKAVEFITDRLPANIHLIIIGRRNIPFQLSNIRAKGELVEISENNLAFTVGEIQSFYQDIHTLSITERDLEEIYLSTGGWAASLVLMQYAFGSATPESIKKRPGSFKQNPEYIFSYLEENIFATQPDYIKDFMIKAALLPEIDTQFCKKIFQVDNADIILNRIVKEHLLIFPVDESATLFYMHHLLKDFLLAKLQKNFSPSEINRLHCQIAHEIKTYDLFEALNHYIDGQAFDEAIRLIEANELKFLLEGKINFLASCLEKIPKPVIEKKPQLMLIQAKLHSHFGNTRQAIEYITQAHLLFKKHGKKDELIRCLVELGAQYYVTGHVKEAKLLMEQVLDDVERQSPTFIITMTFLTLLSSVLGEFDTAKSYYEITRDVIDTYPEFERLTSTALINTSYSYTHYICGDFDKSQKLNRKVLTSVLKLNIAPCLPLVYYQFAVNCFFLKTFEQGVTFAEKGIKACEQMALSDSRKGWVYLAYAQNCLGLGQLEKAIELLDLSIELFEEPGNRWGLANAWDCLHLVYLARGRIYQAKEILTRAIEIIGNYGLLMTEGILEISMANLLMIEKDFQEAMVCLESSRTKIGGAEYYVFKNNLLTARLLVETGKSKAAARHLFEALSISEKKGYHRFLLDEKCWLIPFVGSGLLRGRALNYLNGLFKDFSDREFPVLEIGLMGKFTLFVGNREVMLSHWKSSKALMILKYLAANRHLGFIPREVLIEMLWPDQDIEKTGKRFNMAMSTLRKTLEPDIASKAPSSYIERKKDAYRLCHSKNINIDMEYFIEMFNLAEKEKNRDIQKALTVFNKAQSVYRGAFLEEDRYEEWCIQKRDSLASDYTKILTSVVDIYEAKQDWSNAILYATKIVKTDPWDEMIYPKLMHYYSVSGNLAGIKKTYDAYKKMVTELDSDVMPEIRDLYYKLTLKS